MTYSKGEFDRFPTSKAEGKKRAIDDDEDATATEKKKKGNKIDSSESYGSSSTQNPSRQGSKGDTLFEKTRDPPCFTAIEEQSGTRSPCDEICLEASEHARVWHVYNEESIKKDSAITDAFLTTFIIQSYQQMGPNPSDTTNALLAQLIALQAASLNSANNSINIQPPAKSFAPSPGEIRWVNGLWFAALACSPLTALVSMLVKQLLQVASDISSSPRSLARQRQRRYMQLQNWHVFVVINALPLLFHAALLLFFAGLIVFLWSGDIAITAPIFVIVGLAYAFYIGSMWLSLINPDCPYQHPISEQLRLWTIWFKITSEYLDSNDLETGVNERIQLSRRVAISPPKVDPDDYIDACALVWMHNNVQATIVTTALQVIGGLPCDFSAFHVLRNAGAIRLTLQRFASCFHHDSSFGVSLMLKVLRDTAKHGNNPSFLSLLSLFSSCADTDVPSPEFQA
ncbi:hypothetical protein BYT27DRAFT_7314610 [Phlegmacium glaucopus]|nr:hypothetical protein BYT27DRAFT_7314610 [Phlegmacium glaucopus]